jgi:undecaprenyl diphosphate synthase
MHVGFIMDGNGRWATQKNLSRLDGHTRGAQVANDIMLECVNAKIEYATFYALSLQNWTREKKEIQHIFKLAEKLFIKMRQTLVSRNVKIQVIGNIQHLPEELQTLCIDIQRDTKEATGTVISVCISYGGREEILDAIKSYEGDIRSLTTRDLSDLLPVPDVDLVIRTSGEFRTSNFLLWQSAYAEYHFTQVLWPDFTADAFHAALEEFKGRNRRFGMASAASAADTSDTIMNNYTVLKELFSEYKEPFDIQPLHASLLAEGFRITPREEQSSDDSERGGIKSFSQASAGANELAFLIDDIIDNLPMKLQIKYLKPLYREFCVESIEWLIDLSLDPGYTPDIQLENKTIASIIELFNDTTPTEKSLFSKIYECEYKQRICPDLQDKFIFRILSNYYLLKMWSHELMNNDTVLLYSIIISFGDDLIDEKDDAPELRYITDDTNRIVTNVVNDLWKITEASPYRKALAFVGTSVVLHRFGDNKDSYPIPKSGGDCFKYILDSV